MTPEQYWVELSKADMRKYVRPIPRAYRLDFLMTSEGQGAARPWWWRQAEQRAATRDDWSTPDAAGPTGL